jgi:uncharacterized protein involved in cysteine biosynthesis
MYEVKKGKKAFYKRWWFIGIGVIIIIGFVLGVISGAIGGSWSDLG